MMNLATLTAGQVGRLEHSMLGTLIGCLLLWLVMIPNLHLRLHRWYWLFVGLWAGGIAGTIASLFLLLYLTVRY